MPFAKLLAALGRCAYTISMHRDGDTPHILCPSGREVALTLRRDRRARRYTLRVEPHDGTITLVLPSSAPLGEALRFAKGKARWIERQVSGLLPRVPFLPGAVVPVLGEDHVIRHAPEARRGTWRADGEILVSGFADYVPRRVADYLKREAREALTPRAHDKAARIGCQVARVSLRDTRSRWGSCSSEGRLNFCWRLILAPEPVLDYVVAHEVAHLVHMNHGPRFWSLVETLTEDVGSACRWLKRHGGALHRYG